MGKTRAQTRKMSESDEKEKPTVKRTTTMAQTAKVRVLHMKFFKQLYDER